MEKTKRVEDSLTEQSHLLFPTHLNGAGRLFGENIHAGGEQLSADAGATVEITNEGASEEVVEIPNGTAVTWETGANTLTVKVTAANGTTTKSYVVTVTKS